MKSIWATLILLLAGTSFAPGAFAHEEITWSHDFDASLSQAQKDNKLVFVDFYTDWCGPCKLLDKETFKDAKFTDVINKNFIAVKLNAEQDGKAVAEKQDVQMFPTGIVFSAKGKVLKRFTGFMKADKYAAALKKVSKSGN